MSVPRSRRIKLHERHRQWELLLVPDNDEEDEIRKGLENLRNGVVNTVSAIFTASGLQLDALARLRCKPLPDAWSILGARDRLLTPRYHELAFATPVEASSVCAGGDVCPKEALRVTGLTTASLQGDASLVFVYLPMSAMLTLPATTFNEFTSNELNSRVFVPVSDELENALRPKLTPTESITTLKGLIKQAEEEELVKVTKQMEEQALKGAMLSDKEKAIAEYEQEQHKREEGLAEENQRLAQKHVEMKMMEQELRRAQEMRADKEEGFAREVTAVEQEKVKLEERGELLELQRTQQAEVAEELVQRDRALDHKQGQIEESQVVLQKQIKAQEEAASVLDEKKKELQQELAVVAERTTALEERHVALQEVAYEQEQTQEKIVKEQERLLAFDQELENKRGDLSAKEDEIRQETQALEEREVKAAEEETRLRDVEAQQREEAEKLQVKETALQEQRASFAVEEERLGDLKNTLIERSEAVEKREEELKESEKDLHEQQAKMVAQAAEIELQVKMVEGAEKKHEEWQRTVAETEKKMEEMEVAQQEKEKQIKEAEQKNEDRENNNDERENRNLARETTNQENEEKLEKKNKELEEHEEAHKAWEIQSKEEREQLDARQKGLEELEALVKEWEKKSKEEELKLREEEAKVEAAQAQLRERGEKVKAEESQQEGRRQTIEAEEERQKSVVKALEEKEGVLKGEAEKLQEEEEEEKRKRQEEAETKKKRVRHQEDQENQTSSGEIGRFRIQRVREPLVDASVGPDTQMRDSRRRSRSPSTRTKISDPSNVASTLTEDDVLMVSSYKNSKMHSTIVETYDIKYLRETIFDDAKEYVSTLGQVNKSRGLRKSHASQTFLLEAQDTGPGSASSYSSSEEESVREKTTPRLGSSRSRSPSRSPSPSPKRSNQVKGKQVSVTTELPTVIGISGSIGKLRRKSADSAWDATITTPTADNETSSELKKKRSLSMDSSQVSSERETFETGRDAEKLSKALLKKVSRVEETEVVLLHDSDQNEPPREPRGPHKTVSFADDEPEFTAAGAPTNEGPSEDDSDRSHSRSPPVPGERYTCLSPTIALSSRPQKTVPVIVSHLGTDCDQKTVDTDLGYDVMEVDDHLADQLSEGSSDGVDAVGEDGGDLRRLDMNISPKMMDVLPVSPVTLRRLETVVEFEEEEEAEEGEEKEEEEEKEKTERDSESERMLEEEIEGGVHPPETTEDVRINSGESDASETISIDCISPELAKMYPRQLATTPIPALRSNLSPPKSPRSPVAVSPLTDGTDAGADDQGAAKAAREASVPPPYLGELKEALSAFGTRGIKQQDRTSSDSMSPGEELTDTASPEESPLAPRRASTPSSLLGRASSPPTKTSQEWLSKPLDVKGQSSLSMTPRQTSPRSSDLPSPLRAVHAPTMSPQQMTPPSPLSPGYAGPVPASRTPSKSSAPSPPRRSTRLMQGSSGAASPQPSPSPLQAQPLLAATRLRRSPSTTQIVRSSAASTLQRSPSTQRSSAASSAQRSPSIPHTQRSSVVSTPELSPSIPHTQRSSVVSTPERSPSTRQSQRSSAASSAQLSPSNQQTKRSSVASSPQHSPATQQTQRSSAASSAQRSPLAQQTQRSSAASSAQNSPLAQQTQRSSAASSVQQSPLAQQTQRSSAASSAQRSPLTRKTQQSPAALSPKRSPFTQLVQQSPVPSLSRGSLSSPASREALAAPPSKSPQRVASPQVSPQLAHRQPEVSETSVKSPASRQSPASKHAPASTQESPVAAPLLPSSRAATPSSHQSISRQASPVSSPKTKSSTVPSPKRSEFSPRSSRASTPKSMRKNSPSPHQQAAAMPEPRDVVRQQSPALPLPASSSATTSPKLRAQSTSPRPHKGATRGPSPTDTSVSLGHLPPKAATQGRTSTSSSKSPTRRLSSGPSGPGSRDKTHSDKTSPAAVSPGQNMSPFLASVAEILGKTQTHSLGTVESISPQQTPSEGSLRGSPLAASFKMSYPSPMPSNSPSPSAWSQTRRVVSTPPSRHTHPSSTTPRNDSTSPVPTSPSRTSGPHSPNRQPTLASVKPGAERERSVQRAVSPLAIVTMVTRDNKPFARDATPIITGALSPSGRRSSGALSPSGRRSTGALSPSCRKSKSPVVVTSRSQSPAVVINGSESPCVVITQSDHPSPVITMSSYPSPLTTSTQCLKAARSPTSQSFSVTSERMSLESLATQGKDGADSVRLASALSPSEMFADYAAVSSSPLTLITNSASRDTIRQPGQQPTPPQITSRRFPTTETADEGPPKLKPRSRMTTPLLSATQVSPLSDSESSVSMPSQSSAPRKKSPVPPGRLSLSPSQDRSLINMLQSQRWKASSPLPHPRPQPQTLTLTQPEPEQQLQSGLLLSLSPAPRPVSRGGGSQDRRGDENASLFGVLASLPTPSSPPLMKRRCSSSASSVSPSQAAAAAAEARAASAATTMARATPLTPLSRAASLERSLSEVLAALPPTSSPSAGSLSPAHSPPLSSLQLSTPDSSRPVPGSPFSPARRAPSSARSVSPNPVQVAAALQTKGGAVSLKHILARQRKKSQGREPRTGPTRADPPRDHGETTESAASPDVAEQPPPSGGFPREHVTTSVQKTRVSRDDGAPSSVVTTITHKKIRYTKEPVPLLSQPSHSQPMGHSQPSQGQPMGHSQPSQSQPMGHHSQPSPPRLSSMPQPTSTAPVIQPTPKHSAPLPQPAVKHSSASLIQPTAKHSAPIVQPKPKHSAPVIQPYPRYAVPGLHPIRRNSPELQSSAKHSVPTTLQPSPKHSSVPELQPTSRHSVPTSFPPTTPRHSVPALQPSPKHSAPVIMPSARHAASALQPSPKHSKARGGQSAQSVLPDPSPSPARLQLEGKRKQRQGTLKSALPERQKLPWANSELSAARAHASRPLTDVPSRRPRTGFQQQMAATPSLEEGHPRRPSSSSEDVGFAQRPPSAYRQSTPTPSPRADKPASLSIDQMKERERLLIHRLHLKKQAKEANEMSQMRSGDSDFSADQRSDMSKEYEGDCERSLKNSLPEDSESSRRKHVSPRRSKKSPSIKREGSLSPVSKRQTRPDSKNEDMMHHDSVSDFSSANTCNSSPVRRSRGTELGRYVAYPLRSPRPVPAAPAAPGDVSNSMPMPIPLGQQLHSQRHLQGIVGDTEERMQLGEPSTSAGSSPALELAQDTPRAKTRRKSSRRVSWNDNQSSSGLPVVAAASRNQNAVSSFEDSHPSCEPPPGRRSVGEKAEDSCRGRGEGTPQGEKAHEDSCRASGEGTPQSELHSDPPSVSSSFHSQGDGMALLLRTNPLKLSNQSSPQRQVVVGDHQQRTVRDSPNLTRTLSDTSRFRRGFTPAGKGEGAASKLPLASIAFSTEQRQTTEFKARPDNSAGRYAREEETRRKEFTARSEGESTHLEHKQSLRKRYTMQNEQKRAVITEERHQTKEYIFKKNPHTARFAEQAGFPQDSKLAGSRGLQAEARSATGSSTDSQAPSSSFQRRQQLLQDRASSVASGGSGNRSANNLSLCDELRNAGFSPLQGRRQAKQSDEDGDSVDMEDYESLDPWMDESGQPYPYSRSHIYDLNESANSSAAANGGNRTPDPENYEWDCDFFTPETHQREAGGAEGGGVGAASSSSCAQWRGSSGSQDHLGFRSPVSCLAEGRLSPQTPWGPEDRDRGTAEEVDSGNEEHGNTLYFSVPRGEPDDIVASSSKGHEANLATNRRDLRRRRRRRRRRHFERSDNKNNSGDNHPKASPHQEPSDLTDSEQQSRAANTLMEARGEGGARGEGDRAGAGKEGGGSSSKDKPGHQGRSQTYSPRDKKKSSRRRRSFGRSYLSKLLSKREYYRRGESQDLSDNCAHRLSCCAAEGGDPCPQCCEVEGGLQQNHPHPHDLHCGAGCYSPHRERGGERGGGVGATSRCERFDCPPPSDDKASFSPCSGGQCGGGGAGRTQLSGEEGDEEEGSGQGAHCSEDCICMSQTSSSAINLDSHRHIPRAVTGLWRNSSSGDCDHPECRGFSPEEEEEVEEEEEERAGEGSYELGEVVEPSPSSSIPSADSDDCQCGRSHSAGRGDGDVLPGARKNEGDYNVSKCQSEQRQSDIQRIAPHRRQQMGDQDDSSAALLLHEEAESAQSYHHQQRRNSKNRHHHRKPHHHHHHQHHQQQQQKSHFDDDHHHQQQHTISDTTNIQPASSTTTTSNSNTTNTTTTEHLPHPPPHHHHHHHHHHRRHHSSASPKEAPQLTATESMVQAYGYNPLTESPFSARGYPPLTLDTGTLDHVSVPFVKRKALVFLRSDNDEFMEVGRGTYGCVYLAQATTRRGTAKVVVKDFFTDSTSWELIVHEARMLCYLQDTGVIPHFYGLLKRRSLGDDFSLIQQYFAQGKTLHTVLADKESLDPEAWLDVAWQLAYGLLLIHERHVLLNDLKGDNVLIDLRRERKVIKYIDLGMATYRKGLNFHLPEDQMSKFNFLSPEVRAGAYTSPMSDVYSLGYLLEHINRLAQLPVLREVSDTCMDQLPADRPHLPHVVGALLPEAETAPSSAARSGAFSD